MAQRRVEGRTDERGDEWKAVVSPSKPTQPSSAIIVQHLDQSAICSFKEELSSVFVFELCFKHQAKKCSTLSSSSPLFELHDCLCCSAPEAVTAPILKQLTGSSARQTFSLIGKFFKLSVIALFGLLSTTVTTGSDFHVSVQCAKVGEWRVF